jgi:Putative zinc-finger
MSCPDLLALSQLLDGELPAAEAATLRQHTGGCAACRDRLVRLERTGALAQRLLVAPPAAPVRPAAGDCLAPEDVAAWAERVLPAAAFRAAEAHLGTCDACLADALGVVRTMAGLDAGPGLPVPESLRARVASRWGIAEEVASLGGIVVRVARAGVELLERHVIAPLLDIEAGLVPAPALRADDEGEALGFRIRAPRAEIRATMVPEGDAVGLTLTLVGEDEQGLAGQRVLLRRHGRSIYAARTDAAGALSLPRLDPGVYEVSCPGIDTAFRLDLRT